MADKSVIKSIEARVSRLIEEHGRLVRLCSELTARRDALLSEKRTLEERNRELEAEVARMQLAEGLAGESRNREKARARVNRLMREVDKCIALVESAERPALPVPEEDKRGRQEKEQDAEREDKREDER